MIKRKVCKAFSIVISTKAVDNLWAPYRARTSPKNRGLPTAIRPAFSCRGRTHRWVSQPVSKSFIAEQDDNRQHSHLAKLPRRSEHDSANEGGIRGLFERRSASRFARMIPSAPSTAKEAKNIRCRAPPVTPVCSSPRRPAKRGMRGSTEAC